MSRHRLTVVLSQAQGKNPAKRALEESIAAARIMETGLDGSAASFWSRSKGIWPCWAGSSPAPASGCWTASASRGISAKVG
jgi:hypothetical protein